MQPLSKLEAVNIILDSIGESPVNSLSSGLSDAETAERMLDGTLRDVMSMGWGCNTLSDYEILPDVNGYFVLPDNTLRADTYGFDSDVNVVLRYVDGQAKFYDKDNNTFVFSQSSLRAEIILALEFEELTQPLRRFIAYEAAGRFQKSAVGSGTLSQFIREEISAAWYALLDSEAEESDNNILRDSESVFSTVFRNNPRSAR